MIRKLFTIYTRTGLKTVYARPLNICGVECFVNQEEAPWNSWKVSHRATGFVVSKSLSYRDAVAVAKKRIGNLGKNANDTLCKAAWLRFNGKIRESRKILNPPSADRGRE